MTLEMLEQKIHMPPSLVEGGGGGDFIGLDSGHLY